ncbi:MAG: hypothetical protein NW203_09880 [Hyphomonadaceae bacterium]|nr:hypothetical protein [Hyphomonadaceae bacterium]
MGNATKAAVIYCLLIFAIGFAFGVLRYAFVSDLLGRRIAVLVEVPVMVVLSWALCGWALVRFVVPKHWPARAWMGALAFALMLAAEAALSILLIGRSFAQHLGHLASDVGRIGLVGQVLFGLMPLLRR